MSTRAVAVGVPERLRETVGSLAGVVVSDDLVAALSVLDDAPGAAVLYGEETFGPAVTGQPVLLLDDQKGPTSGPVRRVLMVIDHNPMWLDDLNWDDPRRLVLQAGVRVRAHRVVDLSEDGAAGRLDTLLNELAVPPAEGVE